MRHWERAHAVPEASKYKLQITRLISMGRWHPLAMSWRGALLRQGQMADRR
jgi:hypothetical protein